MNEINFPILSLKNPDTIDDVEPRDIKTCVVGITTNQPYDTSEFINTSTTYYTKISYDELNTLYNYICDENTKEIVNQNIVLVSECYKEPKIKIIFRFLCSMDCANGEQFINETNTVLVYKFVNFVCTRPECLVEFSDHSLGAFVSNWNNEIMGTLCPVKIKPYTHVGKFIMRGKKTDFENSSHPTLKQIGDMSGEEDIVIKFNNMGGTKVYQILNNDIVKLISTGNQEKNEIIYENVYLLKKLDTLTEHDEIYSTVPVHIEFNYKMGKIILSSTHWCNLDAVETHIDVPKLRRYCTDSLGEQATQELNQLLSSTTNKLEYNRIISATVREISSGSNRKFN